MSIPIVHTLGEQGLRRIAPIVRYKANPNPSSLLIIAEWMGASPKVIAKYTTRYEELFPNASILLLKSTAYNTLILSAHGLAKPLNSALEVVLLAQNHGIPIVAAVYSNGGAKTIGALGEYYRSRTGRPIPIDHTLIDSAPGDSEDIASGQRAIFLSLPPILQKGILGAIFWWILGALMAFWGVIIDMGITVNPIEALSEKIPDSRVFAKGGKRTYIYSKEDQMVNYKAVERSAEESKKAGWDTRLERFEGSQHVAHAVKDGDRYWKIVQGALSD